MKPLEQRGTGVADTASEVVSKAQAVITMLSTVEVVLAVVEPLLDEWPEDTIWLQMSSVGAVEADQLAQLAAAHGVVLVDAPVSGSTHPAEEGHLTILVSGPDSARAQVEPVFTALGSRVQWVGEAGMGSRLKLAANNWVIAMVVALAETMHLCELMGLEQQQFITLLDGGPPGSSYGLEKLGEMRRHAYRPAFRSDSRSKISRSSARLATTRGSNCACPRRSSSGWATSRTATRTTISPRYTS